MLLDFASEQEALTYIVENERRLYNEMKQEEIKPIYTNENTHISVMKDGKRLLRIKARFLGDKVISEICADIADLKLIS